jgi:hypothetical protein
VTFVNPTGLWSHTGSYSIEFVPGSPTSHIPANVELNKSVARVHSGKVQQNMGGIDFTADRKTFCWGYRYLRCIRDGNGKLLWVNSNCKNEIVV